jgi:hypothetical protein
MRRKDLEIYKKLDDVTYSTSKIQYKRYIRFLKTSSSFIPNFSKINLFPFCLLLSLLVELCPSLAGNSLQILASLDLASKPKNNANILKELGWLSHMMISLACSYKSNPQNIESIWLSSPSTVNMPRSKNK